MRTDDGAAPGSLRPLQWLCPHCSLGPALTPPPSQLENEMIGRQVKQAVNEKEKALVDHDVMKLEVKRLRDILAMHADEVRGGRGKGVQGRQPVGPHSAACGCA